MPDSANVNVCKILQATQSMLLQQGLKEAASHIQEAIDKCQTHGKKTQ